MQGEDIRGNIFSLFPPKQNWTYPEGSMLSISNEITWDPKHMGWHNISVQESGIEASLSFNISHGSPIRLSIIGDEMLITSDESVEMQSVLVDADGNQWAVMSNWSTGNIVASEWLTDLGDRAIFDGWTVGSWKIFSEYTSQETGQYFASDRLCADFVVVCFVSCCCLFHGVSCMSCVRLLCVFMVFHACALL